MATKRMLVSALLIVATEMWGSAAQQPDSSVERMRAAVLSAQSSTVLTAEPSVKSWGGLSLIPPDARSGQIIQVKVPIGGYAVKATHAIVAARRERAERKAHDEVTKDLQEFMKRRQQ